MNDVDERTLPRSSEIVHNLQTCLQVVALGMEILKEVRDDEDKFVEVCESIDRERRAAVDLLNELTSSTAVGKTDAGKN